MTSNAHYGDRDLTFQPAWRLIEALQSRRVGALELLEAHLTAVASRNPRLNAVIALDEERARDAARAFDNASFEELRTKPLRGLPMTIKDTYEVVGMPATCGLPELAAHRPDQDAVAVAALRQAGAVIFGKTNVPVMASDHQTYNPVYGRTDNPWNPERTPGGSSGGAAAALAAGMTPLELGSDIGGSIRVPAHCCGVFGHKPSYGLVPRRGHIPPMPGMLYQAELAVAGPLARSARDLELALDLVARPEPLAATGWALALPAARHSRLSGYRAALWTDVPGYPLESASRAAIDAFAQDLEHLGVRIDRQATPPLDFTESFRLYFEVLMSIVGAGGPSPPAMPAQAVGGGAGEAAEYAEIIGRASRQSLARWQTLCEQREQLFIAWREFFRDYDVAICPNLPTVAFPHDTSGDGPQAQLYRYIRVDGVKRPYFDNLMWPGIATVANLPATVLPTGRFVEKLPVGVQLIGPYLEDRTTLQLARLIEEALGGFVPPP